MQKKAKVIAFSGIDGCGKSTQLKLVKRKLSENNDVLVAKMTYTPFDYMGQSKMLDTLLKCRSGLEILKYYIGLQNHEYKEYDYILCDRHLMCYLAYAYAYGVGHIDIVRKLLSFVSDPDLILYFDIDINETLKRISSRNEGFAKNENPETLLKAKVGYEMLFTKLSNVYRIDANGSVEETHANVNKVLTKNNIK